MNNAQTNIRIAQPITTENPIGGHVEPQNVPQNTESTDTSSDPKTSEKEDDLASLVKELQKTVEALSKSKENSIPEELRKGKTVRGEFSWSDEPLPIDQHPVYRRSFKALGFSESQATTLQNEIADIAKMVIEHLGSSNPEHVFDYLYRFMRHTKATNIYAIQHELARTIQEERGE